MIAIATATLEDLCYVASWLSDIDRMEMRETRDPSDYLKLALDAYQSTIHKVALDHSGVPMFAFGAFPITSDTAQVWGFKTKEGPRAIRAVTKHIKADMIPNLRRIGVTRAVCYVHEDNHGSRKWLTHLGFKPRATEGELGAPLMLYQRDEPRGPHPS
jgi:hypothetical protein